MMHPFLTHLLIPGKIAREKSDKNILTILEPPNWLLVNDVQYMVNE